MTGADRRLGRYDNPRDVTITRRRFGALVAAGVGLGFSCKNRPVGPTESPLPPLGLARGIPNSTALENLGLITRLAQRERQGAYLYNLDGGVDMTGRLTSSNLWQYLFAREVTGRTDIWEIAADGTLVWDLDQITGRNAYPFDIGSLIKVDSDRMIQLARSAGGLEPCALTPGAYGRTIFRAGPYFHCQVSIGGNGFGAGVNIDFRTGEILERSVSVCP